MISNRTIFIAPLDWGLGHASRCVPIIQKFKNKNKIIIGVSELNAAFFEQYFPELEKINLPSYNVSYSKKMPVWFKLLLQWPKINSTIRRENKQLNEIISKHHIDLVLSDNRFGLYHKQVECIFITHQLNLQTPFFWGMANQINRKFIHRFSTVWVPDHEDKNLRLSGQLSDSEKILIPVKYIGPKSALSVLTEEVVRRKITFLILLSGPEPQRSVLERLLLEKFKNISGEIVLVRGSDLELRTEAKNVQVINYAFGNELRDLIVNAETVICRSGYSTLMDFFVLNKKKMILIPTPGQTEQEYLASYWSRNFQARVVFQQNIKNHNFVLENTV